MATDHFATLINQSLEVAIYSEGAMTYGDAMEVPSDELPFILSTLRKHYDEKIRVRQEFIKTVMEFASKGLETLVKSLRNLGGHK